LEGSTGKVFGESVVRIEDRPLLLGQARFVDDIAFAGMLHLAFVRSPHAHARIASVDASAALAVPGVHAVWTLEDLKPHLTDTLIKTALPSPSFKESRHRPVMADGETLYVGEPVAVVVAEDRYIAEDAAALVMIDYDILPAVGDCLTALDEGAPVYHSGAKSNLAAEFKMDFGDAAAAFASAHKVLEGTFSMHRGVAHSMEGRGGVATWDEIEDRLTLWSSTQTPHAGKKLLCALLGRDDDKVRVATPEIGGGFGPKLVFYGEEVVLSLAALLTRRPAKWIEDRREHFVSTTQERDEIWQMKVAVDADARIIGVKGRLLHDNGAYMVRGVNVPYGAGSTLTLAYTVPALDLDILAIATNKTPVTPIRGAGKPQGVFVMERMIDLVAREMGLDRAEVRRRNLVPREAIPYVTPMKTRGGMQVVLDAGDYPACLRAALERSGWQDFAERQNAARAQGRYIGIGMANYVEGTGRGPYEPVSVRIGENGRIHVACGASAIGQGTKTMLAQIVAEQLGRDMNNITVVTGDTQATELGLGTFNSRHAAISGPSAHAAALAVRKKALTAAAAMLNVGEQALEIEGGYVKLRGEDGGRRLSLGEISTAVAGLPGYFLPGGVSPGLSATETVIINDMTYSNGTATVEVAVDIETGQVTIERVVMVHDCGTPINPRLVAGQIMGGLAHGLGNALYERMTFDEAANPVSTTLAEYLLVGCSEMPVKVDLVDLPTKTPLNELGVKGVGETGVLPMAAAVASAIEDALSPFGARIENMPVSPQDVLKWCGPVRA
jgi:carbon-monoxide dehydrogenase large subunit